MPAPAGWAMEWWWAGCLRDSRQYCRWFQVAQQSASDSSQVPAVGAGGSGLKEESHSFAQILAGLASRKHPIHP